MTCTSSRSRTASRSTARAAPKRSRRLFSAFQTGWHTMRASRPTTGSTSMTSGTTYRTRPWRAPLMALALAPAICFGALDADTLLKSLAHPAPAVTPFVEVRYSKLLDQPIVVKGQLEYHEYGKLVRAVSTPFKERTEILGETVSVQREGKSPRRFSLKRAPELRSMLGGFAAVLGGGRA